MERRIQKSLVTLARCGPESMMGWYEQVLLAVKLKKVLKNVIVKVE